MYKYVCKNVQFMDKKIMKVIKISSKISVKTILITNPILLNSNSPKTNMTKSFGVQK